MTPRIVVLDGYTLNPGDLSWEPLARLGTLQVHDRTAPDAVVERARGAPIVLTNKTPVTAASLAALPELRYVGVLATGTNIVDVRAARQRGVIVSNVPSYGANSVAEHTLALMLQATRHLAEHLEAARGGAWSRQPDFSCRVGSIRTLAGKVLGIVGFGAIGRRVAELALAFKMRVAVAEHPSLAAPSEVNVCGLDQLFASAHFVSLHCPLTEATRHLVDARRLGSMRPDAVLINTARGGLVDAGALASALRAGQLAGACLDVLESEPPAPDHVLTSAPNCWITPHVAWAALEARRSLLEIAVRNVDAFLRGAPVNVVV